MEEGVNYKVHPVYTNYMFGDDGSAWSKYLRKGSSCTCDRWRLLKQNKYKGRCTIIMYQHNKARKSLVHRLILETFVGFCPENMECCHNDGNSLNNKLSNLRWDTRESNRNDMIIHGTVAKGEKKHQSKLKEDDVLEIRRLIKSGMTLISISKIFNISWQSVSDIKYWRRWKHLKEKEALNDSH